MCAVSGARRGAEEAQGYVASRGKVPVADVPWKTGCAQRPLGPPPHLQLSCSKKLAQHRLSGVH